MNELMAGLRQLRTMDQKCLLMVLLQSEVVPAVGEGGLLGQILKWIAEHPEEFAALIALIISLFG